MKDIIINILRIFTKLLKYALITVIGLFFISVILLSGTIRDFRIAYLSGLEGKNQLTEAFIQLKSGNYEEALRNSQLANLNFNTSLERLSSIQDNIFVKKISLFRTQVNYLEYLFRTTEILSSSLERSIPLVKQLEEIGGGKAGNSFANLDNQNKSKFLQLLYESGPEINGLKANLKLALFNIDKIHKISILWPVYGQISEYKTQLQEVSLLLEKISSLIQVLPTLSGYPAEKEFLILLQNNDELRPTGGFIGVFGLAHVKNGNIISLKTSDSYHLDMPAVNKWQKEPPAPLKKYLEVENWYLRDANWVPDWPLAAQKINEIYTGESLAIGQAAPNFAGIIAVNPDFVGGLLNLVGPIKASGEEYNAHNFQELLQYNVEVAYKDRDISSWDRKEIINELLEELKTRLFNLSSNQWVDLAKVITEAIERKDLQMYFFDSTLEELVKNIGAAGEMKQTDSDYLMVVDANLAAFKSDAVVKKKIDYNLSQRNNKTTATLTLNYRHEGDFDWRTTRYRSYTRVYLPYGSRLITSSGLDKNKADWSSTDDQLLNKTVFAFFFTVEPGTEKEISLSYSLPESINQQMTAGTYNLLVQKQSGRLTQELTVTISPEKGGVKNWVTDLWTDKFFQ